MKECNFLQTYEIFLRMMYISLLKEFYMQKEYNARGNVTEYIDGRKTKFVRKYTKTDLLSSEEVFTVKEDDNNYKSTPDASRSYEYDNLNRMTSVLLCLFKHFWQLHVLICTSGSISIEFKLYLESV